MIKTKTRIMDIVTIRISHRKNFSSSIFRFCIFIVLSAAILTDYIISLYTSLIRYKKKFVMLLNKRMITNRMSAANISAESYKGTDIISP